MENVLQCFGIWMCYVSLLLGKDVIIKDIKGRIAQKVQQSKKGVIKDTKGKTEQKVKQNKKDILLTIWKSDEKKEKLQMSNSNKEECGVVFWYKQQKM